MTTRPTSTKVDPRAKALAQLRRAHAIPQYRIAAKLKRTHAWLSQIEIGARVATDDELKAIRAAISELAGVTSDG